MRPACVSASVGPRACGVRVLGLRTGRSWAKTSTVDPAPEASHALCRVGRLTTRRVGDSAAMIRDGIRCTMFVRCADRQRSKRRAAERGTPRDDAPRHHPALVGQPAPLAPRATVPQRAQLSLQEPYAILPLRPCRVLVSPRRSTRQPVTKGIDHSSRPARKPDDPDPPGPGGR